jgi:hypothetical protein
VNEYAFVALSLAIPYLGLLGVLVCVLAEMRHRGKRINEAQDCGVRVGGVDSGVGDGMPDQAESVLSQQRVRKGTGDDDPPKIVPPPFCGLLVDHDVGRWYCPETLAFARRRGRLRIRCLGPRHIYTLRVLWRKTDRAQLVRR